MGVLHPTLISGPFTHRINAAAACIKDPKLLETSLFFARLTTQ